MRFESIGSTGGSAWRQAEQAGADPGAADSHEAGFTLLEVLAALVILAMSLVALYPAVGTAARNLERIELDLSARQLAASIMDEQLASRTLQPGTVSGQYGPFAWSLEIVQAAPPFAPPAETGQWQLNEVGVTVSWGGSRRLLWRTLHLTKVL